MKRLLLLSLLLINPIYAADNISVTAGAGTTVAADEVTDGTLGSVKTQFIKVMDGTIDGTNKLVVTAGGAIPAVMNGVVSSTTLTTSGPGLSQGATAQITITNIGQALTTGIPYALTSSTFNTNISSPTTIENILISSAPAGQYSYLCGCSLANSSTGNVLFTIYKSSSVPATNESHSFQVPANSQAGQWAGCTDPFFRSALAGQITERTSVVVSSLTVRCLYYQAP